MPPTYAYVNLAGSVGKTSTVVATAYILARQGLSVEVVDFDLQAGVSTVYGYPYYDGPTIVDVIRQKASIADVARPARMLLGIDPETNEPVYEEIPNISIVPTARRALKPLNAELASSGAMTRLRKAFVFDADQRGDKQPDVRLIDCGGVENTLNDVAMLSVTAEDDDDRPGAYGVITCAKPAGKELEGIPDLLEKTSELSDTYNRRVTLLSIVPTIIPVQGGTPGAAEKEGRQYHFRVSGGYRPMLEQTEDVYDSALVGGVTPPVRRNTQVDHAFTARTPLPLFKPALTQDIMSDYELVVAYQRERGLFVPRRHLRAA
ncbi:ParA family protein [Nocardia salmonicida]|uniref:ParA family protein n=1 Tax=Nocardia salmonicida TaxID=53431 RepID=UPI0033EB15CC